MPARSQIKLTEEERGKLVALTRHAKAKVRKFIRARALLLSDGGADGPAWRVPAVAEALGVSCRTIAQLKRCYIDCGLEVTLERKKREEALREVVFDKSFEARLIALARSEPPKGFRRWTVRLLADKAVDLKLAESVSHMTVQRVLKKAKLSLASAGARRPRLKGMLPS
jgi:hypothetical protein